MQKPLFYIDIQKAEKNIQFFKNIFQDLLTLKQNEQLYVDCRGNLRKKKRVDFFWFLDIGQYFSQDDEKIILEYLKEFLEEYFNILDDFYFASKLSTYVLNYSDKYFQLNEDLMKSLYVFYNNISCNEIKQIFKNNLNDYEHIFNIFKNHLNHLYS